MNQGPPEPSWSERVKSRWHAASAEWPQVKVSLAEFEAMVMGREVPLESLHAGDVLLCGACAKRDPVALELLETNFFAPLARALKRQHGVATADEALQCLRTRLLVGDGRPRIATYSGAGPLKVWLKTGAVREVIRLERRGPAATDSDLDALEHVAADADPEFDFALAQNRAAFREVMSAVLTQLPPPERALLRRYFVDRQSIDVLAEEWGAHRATMARRLHKVRATLHDALERELTARFGTATTGVSSVVRAFRAQVDVTLDRYLK